MVRRVLLAWEIGGGRGHVHILGWIADALRKRGYEPVFAIQRLDMLETIRASVGSSHCYQAPVWPGIVDRAAVRTPGQRVTVGDILADFGLRLPAAVEFMIQAWDRLFNAIRPDVVIADSSPACLLAARGRIPTIAVGEGFSLPPSTATCFEPYPADSVPKYNEATLLQVVNACLAKAHRVPIDHLPEVYAADRSCVASFSELDPHHTKRRQPNAGPWVPLWQPPESRNGNEIFGYFSVPSSAQQSIYGALEEVAWSGVPVRVHVPMLDSEIADRLRHANVTVEPEPLSFREIQERSRLLISLGSYGFVSSGLVAGIPQLVLPVGLPLELSGKAVEILRVGRSLPLKPGNPLEVMLLSQAILDLYNDQALSATARKLAPDFARRLEPRPAEVVAGYVEELVS